MQRPLNGTRFAAQQNREAVRQTRTILVTHRLNPAERVLANVRGAPERMARVDGVLGNDRLLRFAESVSQLLLNAQSDAFGLTLLESGESRSLVVANMVHAATEFETAWNAIRLCNIPASQRHGRVATEFCARATVLAVPLDLIKSLPLKAPLAKALQATPAKTVLDLIEMRVGESPEDVHEPELRATDVFFSFRMLLEETGFRQNRLQALLDYRREVQHPASHGSSHALAYHFEEWTGGSAGAVFRTEREDSYKSAADQVIALADLMTEALAHVTRHCRR